MNCEEFRAQFLAGENSETARAHLGGCAACSAARHDLETDRETLRDPTIWEEPSPELEDQVVALIGGSQANAESRSGWVDRWMRPLAAAAAVVIAVGLYAVLRSPTPDWEVTMPGTELAPQASSTVLGWNTESGTRMLLEVEGLDQAPAGHVYEFWLSEGPLHISAGTFTGNGEIELWSGVTRADFPRLWVTLEPLNEDESPSGRTFLDTG